MVAAHGPRDQPNEGGASHPTHGWIKRLRADFVESIDADVPDQETPWPPGTGLIRPPSQAACARPMRFATGIQMRTRLRQR